MTTFPRKYYLDKLIRRKNNGLIKVITGIRRCGKSFLLFRLFKQNLLESGVREDDIIELKLEDRRNAKYRNPDACLEYILEKSKSKKTVYVFIDEVQLMADFEEVLNSLLNEPNIDVYVTGSNSRFLSSDVITEFRGRGDEVNVRPLSFSEYCAAHPDVPWDETWEQYHTYGGLPYAALLKDEQDKVAYLKRLFREVYKRDIIERYGIRNEQYLDTLLNIISSSVGSLTNPPKIERAFSSTLPGGPSVFTIGQYLNHFEDAYLVEKAERYDVKGRKYIGTPSKYYFTDVGLRNARINFRQTDEGHIMENVIYNELRGRGFDVDVGMVSINEPISKGVYSKRATEVDFVANKGNRRYYIQSSLSLYSEEKTAQEIRPLESINDMFKKIVIIKDNILPRRNEKGILTIGLKRFLLDPDSLDI